MHLDRMKRLVLRALVSPGSRRVSATVTEWDVAGRCQAPVVRELHSRPSADAPGGRSAVGSFIAEINRLFPGAAFKFTGDVKPDRPKLPSRYIRVARDTAQPLTLRLSLRCRKCDHCRKLRMWDWTNRAKAETQAATRTWFGTLTLRPEAHVAMVSRARVRLQHQGIDFDALPLGEQFIERCRETGAEVTKYIKRVRKASGVRFRYLCVFEHHKSGLPHLHLLVHEQGQELRKQVLASQWALGFEKWRLVADMKQATYLCKYLSKASVARVRASERYGKPKKAVPPKAVDLKNREYNDSKEETLSYLGLRKEAVG